MSPFTVARDICEEIGRRTQDSLSFSPADTKCLPKIHTISLFPSLSRFTPNQSERLCTKLLRAQRTQNVSFYSNANAENHLVSLEKRTVKETLRLKWSLFEIAFVTDIRVQFSLGDYVEAFLHILPNGRATGYPGTGSVRLRGQIAELSAELGHVDRVTMRPDGEAIGDVLQS